MESQACIICNEDSESGLYLIKKVALSTLALSANERLDKSKCHQLKQLESAYVHKTCQKQWNDKNLIEIAKQSFSQKVSAGMKRSSEARSFDFSNYCYFCGKNCNQFKQTVHNVQREDTKDLLIAEIKRRENIDDYKDILSRLENVVNLVGACYHKTCSNSFYGKRQSDQVGRPPKEQTVDFIEKLIMYLEINKTNCQFFLKDIQKEIGGESPDWRTMKTKLEQAFPDQLHFTLIENDHVIIYKNSIDRKMWKLWFESRNKDANVERKRIVEMAAKIIVEDISKMEQDIHYYNLLDADDENSWFKDLVPSSLKSLLEVIILTNKDKNSNSFIKWKKRVATISHSIISSARPRSFLSPIMQGLASFLHKRFPHRILIDALSYVGFCAPYRETLRFEASISKDPTNHTIHESAYEQFIYDNCDHNTGSLDGKNTWHVIGGCKVVTPSSKVTCTKKIIRLQNIPTAEEIAEDGVVEILPYKKNKDGLKELKIEPIVGESVEKKKDISRADLAWLYAKFSNKNFIGWNGFMDKTHMSKNYSTSKIILVPFIDNPPSDYDTIFTVLAEAARENHNLQRQKYVFLTFDQPLFLKA